MKRTLIPLLLCLCLLLTGCGKSKAETAYESFAERVRQADALSFTALLRAEYERKTARFTLSYAEDETGGRVTVLAPELIQGVSAHVAPGGTTLEYDSVVLDTGSLDSFGLSPLSAMPILAKALREGHVDSAWDEDGKHTVQLEPMDGLRCTVWFEPEGMTPLRAELISDGRVTVVLEIRDWHEGGGTA